MKKSDIIITDNAELKEVRSTLKVGDKVCFSMNGNMLYGTVYHIDKNKQSFSVDGVTSDYVSDVPFQSLYY